MKQLSKALLSIGIGVSSAISKSNSFVTWVSLSIRNCLTMTSTQILEASTPRQQTITVEQAQQEPAWLRQLKQQRKLFRDYNKETNTMKILSGYDLPDGVTAQQVSARLTYQIY